MSYIALYRKYRPELFKDIQGQKYVVETLLNSIKIQSVSHAYIFAGPKGIGKTTIAKIFAKALNCLDPKDGDACNQCRICQLIDSKNSTDIIELDAASNNGVDEMRQINDSVNFLPTSLKRKIYIIDEAHMLTNSAWNALLKTIEEPPAHVVFIFATTEAYKIPPTILSRCQYFEFSKINAENLKELIIKVSENEGIKVTDEARSKIISLADGSARDALSMLEQLALYTKNNIDLKSINEVFGLLDIENKINFINSITKNDLSKTMDNIEEFNQLGINFSQLALDITKILIDKLLFIRTKSPKLFKILSKDNVEKIDISEINLIKMINIWQETYLKLKTSSDVVFYFQTSIFKILEAINLPFEKQLKQPLSSNNNQQETPVIIENELLKQFNKLPPAISIFKTKIREVENFKVKAVGQIKPEIIVLQTEKVIEKIESVPVEHLFMQVSFNYDKDNNVKMVDYLKSVKKNAKLNSVLNSYADIKKVLVASKNAAILLADDEVDAELFNKDFLNNEILRDLKNNFGHSIYLLAITNEQFSELVAKHKIYLKEKRTFADVNTDKIDQLIKDDNSILSLANELFKNK